MVPINYILFKRIKFKMIFIRILHQLSVDYCTQGLVIIEKGSGNGYTCYTCINVCLFCTGNIFLNIFSLSFKKAERLDLKVATTSSTS